MGMKGFSVAAALLGVTASGVVYAEGFYLGRASFSPGYYEGETKGTIPVSGGGPCFLIPDIDGDGSFDCGESTDTDGLILAADFGGGMGFKLSDNQSLILDLEVEIMTVESKGNATVRRSSDNQQGTLPIDTDFERSDVKFTLGYSIRSGINYTPFIGGRLAWQGDGFFDDEFYTESGFFVGFGVSGIELSEKLRFSSSVSYNQTTLDVGSDDVDADGYSLRFGLRSVGSPLGYSLKYQTFTTDPDNSGAELEEGYLTASLTWYFLQGRM